MVKIIPGLPPLEGRASSVAIRFLMWVSLAAKLTACGSDMPPVRQLPNQDKQDQSRTQPTDDPAKGSGDSRSAQYPGAGGSSDNGSSLYLADEILSAASASERAAAKIDDLAFGVSGLRATLMQGQTAETQVPIVTFQAVSDADFYQVMRCSGDSRLEAEGINLDMLSSVAVDIKDWAAKLQAKPLWESLSKIPGCRILHAALARNAFIDNDFADGPVKYVIRACSLAQKGVAGEAAQTTCSHLLSLSETIKAKRAAIGEIDQAVRQEISSLQTSLDQASVDLASATRDYARNVIDCERTARKENLAKHRKDLLLAVLGIGARLGAEVLSSGGTDPLTSIRSIWRDTEVLKREPRPVVDVRTAVFEPEKSDLATCAAAALKANKARGILADIRERSASILELARTLATGAREILK